MLCHRLYIRPREESGATDGACVNPQLQKFIRAEGRLTPGSMRILLPSTRETALWVFVGRLYPGAAETFFGAGGVAARLQEPHSVELRNRAAHTTRLGREGARSARTWALAILRHL